ncbi:MAG: hypothetical protein V2I32_09790 [Desulforhopalus sp.]|jgi:hypothetical protein|nr:hypothetical protein [Desulforhopalus sp.]
MGHDRHLARMTDLDLALKVGEPGDGEGGGNDLLGHVAAALTQQGDQVGLRGLAFAKNGFARAGGDVRGPEIGGPVAKRLFGLPDGKLLEDARRWRRSFPGGSRR